MECEHIWPVGMDQITEKQGQPSQNDKTLAVKQDVVEITSEPASKKSKIFDHSNSGASADVSYGKNVCDVSPVELEISVTSNKSKIEEQDHTSSPRKRKRKRNRKKQNNFSSSDVGSLVQAGNADFGMQKIANTVSSLFGNWPVNKDIKMRLPDFKKPSNKRITFDDSEDYDNSEPTSESVVETNNRTNSYPEVNSESTSYKSVGYAYDNIGVNRQNDKKKDCESFVPEDTSTPVCSLNGNDLMQNISPIVLNSLNTQTPQHFPNGNRYSEKRKYTSSVSASTLSSGITVYTRQRRTARENVIPVPLSKKAQLNTVADNRSIILQNPPEIKSSNSEPGNNCEVEYTSESKAEKQPENEIYEAIPLYKDYSRFPPLVGPPRVGDKIAYKILEMSENYTPEVSAYKEAEVKCYNPITTDVTLKRIKQCFDDKREVGKFEVTIEDDLSLLTSVEQDSEEVMLKWDSVLEPKLISWAA